MTSPLLLSPQRSRRARQASCLLIACFWLTSGWAQELPGLQGPAEQEESAAANERIAIDASATPDSAITGRLEGLFGQIRGLEGTSVQAEGGVVTLRGTVPTAALRDSAEALASRLEGVVAVDNQLELDRQLGNRLRAASDRLIKLFYDFVALLPSLLAAVVIFAAFWLIGRWLAARDSLYVRLSRNPFVRNLLQQFVRVVVVIAGIALALEILNAGAVLGSIAGAVGIAGLAIGFATRDTVENYIASILLSLRQPFSQHDHLLIEGMEGKVIRLTPRATILMSLDGNHIRIPNATVFKSTIVNYTHNPLRRFDFEVGVDTDLDLAEPQRLALECLQRVPGVLEKPEPQCLVSKLGESNVVLTVMGWVDQDQHDFMRVRSEALRSVKDEYDAAGIVMPEPIYNVKLRRASTAGPDRTGKPVSETTGSSEPRVAKDVTIDEQIVADNRAVKEENLLRRDAPRE